MVLFFLFIMLFLYYFSTSSGTHVRKGSYAPDQNGNILLVEEIDVLLPLNSVNTFWFIGERSQVLL